MRMRKHGRLGAVLLVGLGFPAALAAPLAVPASARAGDEASDREAKRRSALKALEEGAFAEEHERDFLRARDRYRQAAIDARLAGDAALADEVRTRLEALERRLAAAEGKVEPGSPLAGRIRSLIAALSEADEKVRGQAAADLVTIGAPAVPALEDALVRPQVDAIGRAADFRLAAWALGRIEAPSAADALLRALDSPDPLVRRAAAEAAAKLPYSRPRLSPVLEKAFRDANADVRRGAIQGLEAITGEIRGWLRPHLERLASEDADFAVREGAVSRLALIEEPALRAVLDPAARRGHARAIDWIARHGGDGRESVLEPVARDRALPFAARRGAIYGLHQVGGAGAAVSLARVVVDGDPDLAEDAVTCLARVLHDAPGDTARAIGADLRDGLVTTLARAIERGDTVRYAGRALEILSSVPDPRAVPAVLAYLRSGGGSSVEASRALDVAADATSVPGLLEEIRLAEARGGRSTASRLAWVVSRKAKAEHVDALIAVAARTENDDVFKYLVRDGALRLTAGDPTAAIRACRAFEGDKRERVAAFLLDSYRDEEPPLDLLLGLARDELASIREAALERLARSARPETLPVAIERLLDPSAKVRQRAVGLIEKLDPSEDAVPALIARLRDAEKLHAAGGLDLHAVVIQALWRLPPGPTAGAIVALLDETPPLRAEVRVALFQALVTLEAPAIVGPALVKHHAAMPGWARQQAAERLGKLLYREAVPTLIELLRDPDPSVRLAAKKALDEIKVYYREKEEWERWQKQGDEVDDVVKALDSEERRVVLGAVRAVGALKQKTALPRLVRLLATESFPWQKPGEDDVELREAVQAAIEKIAAE